MARPSHSLSTLRRPGRPGRRKTHFWLLARLYQVGLVTHRVPSKGFRAAPVTSLPPFPVFAGRKNDQVQQRGRLERSHAAKSRSTGPVSCNGWILMKALACDDGGGTQPPPVAPQPEAFMRC